MVRIKTLVPCILAFMIVVLQGVIINIMTASAQVTTIPGELAHYSFEEGSGISVGDSSGNGNGGIIYGASWTTGKVGNALSFDNIDDYVSIPTQNSDEISFCTWFYKNGNDTVNADAVLGGLRNHADLQLKEGFDFIFFNSSPDILRFTVVTQNVSGLKVQRTAQYNFGNSVLSWYHVVGTYNKTTGGQKLYVNGQLIHTANHPAGNTMVPLTYFPDMKIGQTGPLTRNAYFNGIIDEVRIFNRPLSDDEVMAIYESTQVTPTPSPSPSPTPEPSPSPTISPTPEPTPSPTPNPIPGELAHYSFEEGVGVSVGDSSGNGNDGIIYGATWTAGKIGSALSFDNIDDYVSIPTQNSDEVSFCAWFYKYGIDAVNADALFGGLRNHANLELKEGFDFKFFDSSPNILRFTVETQNTSGTKTQRSARYEFANSAGSWYHVVGTYNKTTGDQKLYLNGQWVHSVRHPAGNTIVPLTYFPDMKIGQSGPLTRDAYFNGIIDEIRIFNRPLSDDEVMAIYNN